ncbi:major facilitator superfamily domain-containing protein [Mucidula mucida]|nr:major facilitator superfamily domain-containing protein [Mucidula mucida]
MKSSKAIALRPFPAEMIHHKYTEVLSHLAANMFALSKERLLLIKIDFSVLLLCTLMTWSNYINRANLSFGYVSGMKEELHFVGNDYTTMGAVFNIGYFFAMFAHSFAIQKFRPRYWLGSMAVLWGCFGIASFGVKTIGQLYACRVLISLAEACVFSGAQFILSHWYKVWSVVSEPPVGQSITSQQNSELGLRGAIFASGANFGTLFSGVLQGAIYDSLNGHSGYSGWRWTFFVDGLIGIVIGLLLLAFFPDTPETTKSWIFTAEEKQLAIKRLPSRNFEDVPVNWEGTKQILRGWRFWGFSLLFTLTSGLEAYGSYGIVPIWLKSLNKYSVSHYSYYALGLTAVTISTTIVSSACTDRWGYRHYATYVECILMIVSASMLIAWDIPLAAKFFAFFLGELASWDKGV